MSKIKITTRVALKVAKIIGKLDLDFSGIDAKAEVGEVGKTMLLQIINKLGDAEEEVIELIAAVKGCSKEEALEVDLVELFKDETGEDGLLAFFSSAVKSRMPGL